MFATSVFFIIVGIILAIIIGINLGSTIDNTILYFLFWFMYILTIATFVNIGLSIYYYTVMKNKSGPRGLRGERGDKGKLGDVGSCDIGCRNKICESDIKEHIIKVLNDEERKNGNPNSDLQVNDLRNIYIKEKIKSMCQSPEYQQMVPYKGANNLINYLKEIWGTITKQIYNSGGITYFKTIGAENDWDWVEHNPWNEFKKYDVYYWGMSKDYRPQLVNKCKSNPSGQKKNENIYPHFNNFLSGENENIYKTPSKKNSKYSILSYTNIPNSVKSENSDDGVNSFGNSFRNTFIKASNKTSGSLIKLYNAFTYKPNQDIIDGKYSGGSGKKLAKTIKPLTYLISHPDSNNSCLSMNTSGNTYYNVCNPYDKKQLFTLDFTGKDKTQLKEFKIKHGLSDNYITNYGRRFKKSNYGNTYKF